MNGESPRLLELAREGDVDAFARLFEALRPTVFAVACRLVGESDAEDVVMESYLKAWQALPRFKGRSSLKTWLYRIVRNCGLDLIRARQRRPEKTLYDEEDAGERPLENMPDEAQRSPDQVVALQEEAAAVRRALERLAPEHRVPLQLRFADGLSYAEIAAATGVSIGTVMSRLFYGKQKLRKILEGEAET